MDDRATLAGVVGAVPTARAIGRTALVGLATILVATGPGLAHTGHDSHGGGGSSTIPAAILVGSVVVIGIGAYLGHADAVDGRLARAGVLLGIAGVVVGLLAAV